MINAVASYIAIRFLDKFFEDAGYSFLKKLFFCKKKYKDQLIFIINKTINEYEEKMGDRWVDNDRIFTQSDGKPVHPDSISGFFRDFISKTDLPQVTIHSLRHTNITLLIAAGVPLRTVSYRAGHASTQITYEIYCHALRTADELAVGALEDILKPKIIVGNNKNAV